MNSIYERIQNLRQNLHIGGRSPPNQPPPVHLTHVTLTTGETYSPMRVLRPTSRSRSRSPHKLVQNPAIMLAGQTLGTYTIGTNSDTEATATLHNETRNFQNSSTLEQSLRVKIADARMTPEDLCKGSAFNSQ